ncbi:hypothetical protein SRRS_15810 [Sporomusa rhizae]
MANISKKAIGLFFVAARHDVIITFTTGSDGTELVV